MGNNDADARHQGFLLEYLQGQFQLLLEGQAALRHVPAQLQSMSERLENVEADVKVIKAVVTDQSGQLKDHERRITRLEQEAA